MNRFRPLESLQAATRARIPRVSIAWLAAARAPIEALTTAALDPAVSDSEFLRRVQDFADSLPSLMDSIDHDALAALMEESMGAAAANGIAARLADTPPAAAADETGD
jgi:surfactin synthase thioesterase subunit